ncbi:hypothetical protein P153DRAFT_360990 [Dothidotthia symphoricarpi CBS 119687]|uniref:Uncharacterized protein n=1 Tax=Dothidotthia symphoricarpi CBS 119687 TaxID=1392245 RepID=A0A6A6A0Z2_9PLEO|nr:uncharacterized protein P153DRAFT_360990 [Dothidotthia symphoricarpi CBS 119687]KAF2124824.1 hypothetical protein P153DRAFT_360990 [Dothidotthia symphoricarpi CBS 119687]
MGKRHNRKRTRSRPRHRNSRSDHIRSDSVNTNHTSSSYPTTSPNFQPQMFFPITSVPADHWHQTYLAWQVRLRLNQEHERERSVEAQRLRVFGGMPEDETCLLEPMLRVVTDLFDGETDYEDP